MTAQKLIQQTYMWMLQGRRFRLKEIDAFRDAIWRESQDGRIEAMMLFMAEALHDTLGFGHIRTARVLRYCDKRMAEFIEETHKGTFSMDDLRIRVFGKTHFMFAMSAEDQEHIVKVLTDAGYKVTIEKGEDNGGNEKESAG